MTSERTKERLGLDTFKERMYSLERERMSIHNELRSIDMLGLARRTRELLRATKGLMDGNVTVLFAAQPAYVPDELYKHLEWAEGHINRALAEEYDFDAIKHRLFMATSLSEYVIHGVQKALTEVEEAMDTRGV